MRPAFHETVDVLVKAYLNDTLYQGHPCGCAIGNLIAARNGHKVLKEIYSPVSWVGSMVGSGFDWYEVLYPGKICGSRGSVTVGIEQINSIGYSIPEVIIIEEAFESTRYSCSGGIDESMFNGLMAVVDVLADIHGISLDKKEEAKKLFVKV
jgi:hypothetical protein